MKTEMLHSFPKNWKDLEPHPLSTLIEFGAGIDVAALAGHMREHGYDSEESIVLLDGKILDGRHKHIAAQEAGVTPTFRRYIGDNPAAYVAKKLHRQHLNQSQRSMMGAKILAITHPKTPEKSRNADGGVTNVTLGSSPNQQEIADALNVSRMRVNQAVKVNEHGTEELQDAVMDGTISVSDAAAVAAEPKDVQKKAVKRVRKGKAKTVKAAVTAVKGDADEGPAEEMTDQEGEKVPVDAVQAFQAAKDIEGICREIDAMIKRVEEISKGPGGRLIRFDSFKQQMKDAKGNLWANRATHVCSYCKGTGKMKGKTCECCKGECWTAKYIWQQAPGNHEKVKK